jgi:hypothetical protein
MLLFLFSLVLSGAAYFVYLNFYGGMDGLPVLPKAFLQTGDEAPIATPSEGISPTVIRLIEAFGQNSPEVQDRVAYTLRLEDRERGLVISSGQPVFRQEPSRFVTVSPFSIAFFAKPKPANQLAPGEVQEFSTFHAERAVLEFEREVANAQDLNGKAKLVGMELVSLPDMPSVDERRGFIEITNNQRSRDRSQYLVFRTTGPLFYSAPKAAPAAKPAELEAPHVWTSAPVVVVDRKNLAKPLRSRNWETASVSGDDLRGTDAISNILMGNTLPPPTITAIGMKIYLLPDENNTKSDKRNSTGFSGVRMIELGEKVQFNLWTDDSAGFPGSAAPSDIPVLAKVEPPEALLAVTGGLSDAFAIARQFEERSLMVIETLGSFRHDFSKNEAKFQAAPGVATGVPNHVVVARLSASGKQDNLYCQTLLINFADKKDAAKAPKSASGAGDGMKIKSLTATGPYVFVSIESEQLKARGNELVYTNEPATRSTTTTLRGAPVTTVREKNRLEGGADNVPGEIVLKSTEPDPKTKNPKQTTISVNSRGRLEIFDEASNANTLRATWGKSLTQSKEMIGKEEQDVLTFEGGSSFQDIQGGMQLSGDTLRLWLSGVAENGKTKGQKSQAQPLPQRVLAVGTVSAVSGDMQIDNTDQLTIWFRDIAAPKIEPAKQDPAIALNPPSPNSPLPGEQPKLATPLAQAPKASEEPAQPKPPVKIQARVIESWVTRYPMPEEPKKAVEIKLPDAKKQPTKTVLKYEVERTRCDDRVVVHQDPADPKKNPRGLDISGIKLNLEQSKAGSLMTVYGTSQTVAQVHFESLSLFGPVVVIDQPNNSANVPGYGKLIMPTTQEQAGTPRDGKPDEKVAEMEITWTKSMNFQGAKAFAEFIGNVRVTQQPVKVENPTGPLQPVRNQELAKPKPEPTPEAISRTRVVCHRLDTTFDKPIYFNQNRNKPKSKDSKEDTESAKIKTAVCTPMSETEAAQLPRDKVFTGVIYLDETINPVDGKYVKAQRIDAKMLEMNNDPKGRIVIATGPGEVRMLQLGSKDGVGNSPEPKKTAPKEPAPKESGEEMKLTLVKFPSRMVARDTAKRYQEARFDEGAQVWHIPSDNLNLQFTDHAPPKRTVYISCAERLTVSSTPSEKPGQPAQQEMEALGNGEFENDDYRGTSGKILYDGNKVIFEGTTERLAKFYKKRVGINNTHNTSARRIEYYKDGNVRYLETATGTFGSNP